MDVSFKLIKLHFDGEVNVILTKIKKYRLETKSGWVVLVWCKYNEN